MISKKRIRELHDGLNNEVFETIYEAYDLQEKNKQLTQDYCNVVKKFDDCRSTLAWICKLNGINPNGPAANDPRPWHEYLIDELEAKFGDKNE